MHLQLAMIKSIRIEDLWNTNPSPRMQTPAIARMLATCKHAPPVAGMPPASSTGAFQSTPKLHGSICTTRLTGIHTTTTTIKTILRKHDHAMSKLSSLVKTYEELRTYRCACRPLGTPQPGFGSDNTPTINTEPTLLNIRPRKLMHEVEVCRIMH